MNTSKIINVAVASNVTGEWYYNLNTNTFNSSLDYSISDNVDAYDITDLESAKDAFSEEFTIGGSKLRLEQYNTETNEFVQA